MVKRAIRFFTENWGLKLTALGMAILLWMGVRASEPERATFPGIPVEVDLSDPDWRLAGEPEPPTVTVTVLGPTGELMSMATDPPRIVVPVERVTDTLESQVMPLQWVQLPAGVRDARVLDLRPDTIRLRYERLASSTLPVRVRTSGSLPEGYTLMTPVRTNPAVVAVRGPRQRLGEVDSIPLVPVDLSGLRTTTNVPTRVDTAAVPGLQILPEEVNVILQVAADSAAVPADTGSQRPPF
ncbi:MAG: CdaR family protein [Candidatus Longimicrobiales bacterium M2_2A_002]